jgi:hypothetical protein
VILLCSSSGGEGEAPLIATAAVIKKLEHQEHLVLSEEVIQFAELAVFVVFGYFAGKF